MHFFCSSDMFVSKRYRFGKANFIVAIGRNNNKDNTSIRNYVTVEKFSYWALLFSGSVKQGESPNLW